MNPPYLYEGEYGPLGPANTPLIEPIASQMDAPGAERAEEAAFLSGYQRLARKIGYRCLEAERAVGYAALVAWLHEEGIAAYSDQAVSDYLHAAVAKMNAAVGPRGWADGAELVNAAVGLRARPSHAWCWTPLRPCDWRNSPAKVPNGAMQLYTKPIPYPVLCTIEKIVDRFGEEVMLEVSDIYTVPKADPFLSVSALGSAVRFPIERWDEPKFRG
jgi:hypothetical protein